MFADEDWDLYILPSNCSQPVQISWHVYRGKPVLSCCVGIFSDCSDATRRALEMAELFNRVLPRVQVHVWEAAAGTWRTLRQESALAIYSA